MNNCPNNQDSWPECVLIVHQNDLSVLFWRLNHSFPSLLILQPGFFSEWISKCSKDLDSTHSSNQIWTVTSVEFFCSRQWLVEQLLGNNHHKGENWEKKKKKTWKRSSDAPVFWCFFIENASHLLHFDDVSQILIRSRHQLSSRSTHNHECHNLLRCKLGPTSACICLCL